MSENSILSTPIGNQRYYFTSFRVLRAADLVVAEDTRHTRKLLSHFDIHKPLLSCHEHNKARQVDEILERVASGQTIAVVNVQVCQASLIGKSAG